MKKILLAGVLGGLALLAWGMISWIVLPFHMMTMKAMPNEDAVAGAIAENLTESGMYYYPAMTADASEEEAAAMEEKYRRGPRISMMVFHPGGADPWAVSYFIYGFLLNFFGATLVAMMLAKTVTSLSSYFDRILFGTLVGVLICIAGPLTNMNWVSWPVGFSLTLCLDLLVGWTLVGAIAGKIIRPQC